MKTRFLFPHKWRITGYILFIAGAILYILKLSDFSAVNAWPHFRPFIFGIDTQIIIDDIEYLAVICGLMLIGFTKEGIEDEQIAQLRLDSLQWAVYFNSCIIIICIIFVNGINFLDVMAYNIISPLLFFVIRFRWKIYSINRLLKLS